MIILQWPVIALAATITVVSVWGLLLTLMFTGQGYGGWFGTIGSYVFLPHACLAKPIFHSLPPSVGPLVKMTVASVLMFLPSWAYACLMVAGWRRLRPEPEEEREIPTKKSTVCR